MEQSVNLSGEWIGLYTGHFEEVIRVTQDGANAVAVKVTGDDHVPAGAVTWRADVSTGKGEGQIADREFRNARFIPGRLEILGPDRIKFFWEDCGAVEYRRDE